MSGVPCVASNLFIDTGNPFCLALLLMSFASKWPLPVTHSVFSELEIVVLGFKLESKCYVCFS